MFRWFAVLSLVIAGGLLRPEAAHAAASSAAPRLLFVAPTQALLARVEGQLSDLDVEVLVLPDAEMPSDIESDAAALAERQRAEWVVWTRAESASELGSDSICIWSRSSEPMYCRRFAAASRSADPGDSSAGYELAALSVRSAVRARMLELQAEQSEAQRKPAAVALAPQEAQRDTPPAAQRAPAARWFGVELGAGWLWEGLAPTGAGALHAAGVLGWQQLRFGLGASLAQRTDVNLEQINVQSRRGSAELGLGVVVARSADFVLQPEVGIGALWHTRTSSSVFGAAEATPPVTLFAAYVGARAKFEYTVTRGVDLCFTPGLDWVPRAHDWIVLDAAESTLAARRSWHLQPDLRLSIRAALW